MTIDHDRFAEANQPPPAKVTETLEVEPSPEVEPALEGSANVDGVAVACRLEEGTMRVTVLLPGRIESISTSVLFDVTPAPESGGSYSNELPPAYAAVADIHDGLGLTPEAHIRPVPHVTCSGCGRQAVCARMLDGTVYRPFAWTFPDAQTPRVGLCGGCTPHEPIWRYGGPG